MACSLCAIHTVASAQDVQATRGVQATEAAGDDDAWHTGSTRAFIGGHVAVGALAEARVMAGYGKPHWTWVGLEAGGVTTTQMGYALLRARLALVIADLAITWRRTWGYTRHEVARQDSYVDDDLARGPSARYGSIDLWAWGIAPVPAGLLDWEIEASYVYDVAPGHDVYEEYLRGVTQPGWSMAARLGYELEVSKNRGYVGPLLEAYVLFDRGTIWRAGPDFNWALSPAWDLGARVTVALASPDALSWFNGLGGTLRMRFRWASGS